MGHYSLHTPARCTRFFYMFLSMTHASLFVSALSRRRRWPSRASRPLVPLYIYVYIRLRANSASRIANRGAAFGMGIPFPLSFDRREGRHRHDSDQCRHAGRAFIPYGFTLHTCGRGFLRLTRFSGRLAPRSRGHHCFANAARESDSGHTFLSLHRRLRTLTFRRAAHASLTQLARYRTDSTAGIDVPPCRTAGS